MRPFTELRFSLLWPIVFCSLAAGLVHAGPAHAEKPPVAISGLILGADLMPLAGADARLFGLDDNYHAGRRQLEDRPADPLLSSRSDAAGRFRLLAPRPGVYLVRVEAAGHVAAVYRPLPVANDLEMPPVALQPASQAVLEFRRQGGAPVGGAFISVTSSAAGPVPAVGGGSREDGWRPAPRSGRTGIDGRLVVDKAVGEWLDLAIVPPWSHRPQRILGVEGVRYFLDPAEVPRRFVEIRDPRGVALEGILALLGAEGIPLGTSDAEGRLVVAGHFEEPEPLQLLAADGRRWSGWYVTPPEGIAVERQLPDLEPLAGRALSITGRRPLEGALVWSSRDPGRFTHSAEDGSWLLEAAPSRAGLWLEGRARGHLPRLYTAKTRGEHRRPIDLVLEKSARLAGVVVDPSGRPIPYVELWLETANPWPSFRLDRLPGRAITDSRGRFQVEPLWAEASYSLGAFKLGFVEARLAVDRSSFAAPLTLVMELEQAAFGRVVDSEDVPVAGAAITALPVDGRALRISRLSPEENPFRGVSDQQGRFQLAALPAATITLEAERPGFAPMKIRGLEVGGELEAGAAAGPVDLGTLVLEKGLQLEGRVVDERGEAIAEASIWSVEAVLPSLRHQVEDLRATEPTGHSDPDGWFSLEDLVPGRALNLVVFRTGFLPHFLEGVAVPARRPVELVLPDAATLAGRVVDGAEQPIAGASVSLDPKVFEEGSLEPTRVDGDDVQATLTDGDGRYLFDIVTPGAYRVRASSNAHQPATAIELEVESEDRLDDVDFVLEEGAVVAGLALTEDGDPLGGVRVTAGHAYDISDREGRFRLLGIPPGRQLVEGRHPSLSPVREQIDIELGETSMELIFSYGVEIEGQVTDAAGRALGGVVVAVDGGRTYTEFSSQSDSEGFFLLEGVGAGDYRLRASKQGYAPYEQADGLRIADSPKSDVRIVLEAGGSIAGQLHGLDFEALETVRVTATSGHLETSGAVDYDGRYRIEDLAGGDWLVRASVPGSGREAHARVPLGAGEKARQDLDFTGGVTLTGSVLWNGSPLPRTHVALRGLDAAIERQTLSDHEGHFELGNLRPGRYRVDASNSRQFLTQNLDLELDGDRDLVIEFDTARVEGRVRAEQDDRPLANALVILHRQLDSDEPGSVATVGTSGDGSFRFGRLVRGRYALTVKLDGFEPLTDTLEVDGDVGPLDLALASAAGLELLVRRSDGSLPPYIHLSATGDGSRPVLSEGRQVSSDGRVVVPTLPAGDVRLWLAAPGSVPRQIDARVPSAEPVTVTFEPAGRLLVRVDSLVRSDGIADLRLTGPDGQPWRAFDVDTGLPQETWSVVAGVATVEGLPPGHWQISIEDSAGTRWQSSAATNGGQLTQVHLD